MQQHICFVTDEIDPGTMGGIGRLINAAAHDLTRAGWQLTFLLATDVDVASTFRAYARVHFPTAQIYRVDEVLEQLSTDDDIPLRGFHFPKFHRSYRVALALQHICQAHTFDGVEFNDHHGLGYITLKWRRLWGGVFSNLRMWIRLHGTSELWSAADDELNYSREQLQLFAMERYCLQHADGWISAAWGTTEWYRAFYERADVPVVVSAPAFEHLGVGNVHPRTLGVLPYHILFYSKIQRIKGTDIFVKAAVELCETTELPLVFDIVGQDVSNSHGSFQASLERLIPAHLRSRFHFHGRIQPAQLEALATSCVLAIFPSRVETFCLAAHELNWIGLPLILNDLPAFRDYFADGRDCRTFNGTNANLAQVVREVLSQPHPFTDWPWNAPDVVAHNRGAAVYEKAIQLFQPFGPPTTQATAPLVSIIVPYYNMQDYVEQTLVSIQQSTYTNWEAIVVDDGSPSEVAQQTFRVLAEQYTTDKRYRFVQKSNGGLGSARNYGFRLANGTMILPLDSDDVIHPEYIAKGVQALQRLPELAAVSCFVSFFLDGQAHDTIIDYVIPYDLHPTLITLENRAGVACSLFRREVFERFSYDETLAAYEDWELWLKIAEAGWQAETMPQILYRYRRRRESMFHSLDIARHTHLMHYVATAHASYFRQHGNSIFHMYLTRLADLRYENAALLSGGGTELQAVAQQMYHEIRNTRRSRTFRLAQMFHKLAAPARRIRNPQMRYNEASHNHTLIIEVLPTRNVASQGNEVWVVGLRTYDTNSYLLTSFRTSAGWKLKDVQDTLFDCALLTNQAGQELQASVRGDTVGLMFLHHAWSGQVVIRMDQHVQQLDLYAPEGHDRFVAYSWNGRRWEQSSTPWF